MQILIKPRMQKPKDASWEDWLMAKVVKTQKCWNWTGHSPNGRYGNLSYEGRSRPAHVVSYILFKGPVPEGMEVCHTCDNGFCVRPSHLWLGTHKQNMEDRRRKGKYRVSAETRRKISEGNKRRPRELYVEIAHKAWATKRRKKQEGDN